jgi:hypothetical protein
VFGYTIEKVEPATEQEAALFKLPAGCIQLLVSRFGSVGRLDGLPLETNSRKEMLLRIKTAPRPALLHPVRVRRRRANQPTGLGDSGIGAASAP